MNPPKRFLIPFFACLLLFASSPAQAAGNFTIVVMQDDKDAAKKLKPLETYLKNKGIKISIAESQNYSTAAHGFNAGKYDAMFSGSGVAGIFILKGLAAPVVRPVSKEGNSTYHAVILAPKGSPPFTGNADYFKDKRVAFPSLASAGEIFFYSIPKIRSARAEILKMSSHGTAIFALSKGAVDVAIVKNRVWEKHTAEYPGIEVVGEDGEENPDGVLIASMKSDKNVVARVSEALLALKSDISPEARAVCEQLGIKGYIRTTEKDFKHTFELFKRAGVDASFDFRF